MSLFTEDGTRVTATSVQTMTTPEADPMVTIEQTLYKRHPSSPGDGDPDGGSIRTLFCQAGYQVRQSQIADLFDSPGVASVTPNQGPIAGGDVVSIKGNHLDGVTAVSFGGTAAASIVHVSTFELEVTTPAVVAAGVVDLVLTGDEGDVTETGAYTYV